MAKQLKSAAKASQKSSDRTSPSGVQVIEGYLKTLPGAPGVYRMINARGDVLYVG